MIVVHAKFPLDPANRDEALDMIKDLVEHSQNEDGMIDYQAAIDVSDPNVVRFFEQYEDVAAIKAHPQTEHFQQFEERLPDILAGDPEVIQFNVESATELEL